MSATRLIRTAIYGVLSADSTLAGLSLTIDAVTGVVTTVGVFNDVPDGQTFPHVLISKNTEIPWHTQGGASVGLGWNDIIRIHIYSRYQGDLEAEQILERIVALLNYQDLTVTGYATVIVALESMRALVEDIKKIETRHIVAEFRVRVHQ